MKILAVDPGLDDTGWACFDYDRFLRLGATPQAGILALVDSGTIHTSPKDNLVDRIQDLAREMDRVLSHHKPVFAVLEAPSYSGDYGPTKKARSSLNGLYVALGGILAVLVAHTDVDLQPASRTPKAQRLASLEMTHSATPDAPPLPKGPRGGKREDEMDAIHLGWWALIGGDCYLWKRGKQ